MPVLKGTSDRLLLIMMISGRSVLEVKCEYSKGILNIKNTGLGNMNMQMYDARGNCFEEIDFRTWLQPDWPESRSRNLLCQVSIRRTVRC